MRKIDVVGVVGAGSMGTGIAQLAAQSGHEVILYDLNEDQLIKSRDQINANLNKLVQKGKLSDAEASVVFGNLRFGQSLGVFSPCDLIIEAVVENLQVKRELFTELEKICCEDTIFSSNTSSLSVASIGSSLKNPNRFLGLHFFNPATLMPLVEVVPAIQTGVDLPKYLIELMYSWGKVPVLAQDSPGFIVNRIARPFYSESLRLLEENLADEVTIDFVMRDLCGFKMGPFELMDFIGHDVNFAVTCSIYQACWHEARYKPSFIQQRLVEAGYLGRKSGRGFYIYHERSQDVRNPIADSSLHQLIKERILFMLFNEAADAWYYRIASAEDIDLAMTKGVNYPKGLLQWAEEVGVHYIVEKMDEWFEWYKDSRYRCSPGLRMMAGDGKSFFNT